MVSEYSDPWVLGRHTLTWNLTMVKFSIKEVDLNVTVFKLLILIHVISKFT